jgi:F0F1-type ATP synthase epsilon subunit
MKDRIHAADKKILEAEALEVVLPGRDGEFTAMDFHQPCLYGLRAGRIRVKHRQIGGAAARKDDIIAIRRGVAKVASNELVVLAET